MTKDKDEKRGIDSPDHSLPSPAAEILDYLARHPDAQDTVDGILQWWLLDAQIRKWAPKIAESVAQLVERGFLEQRPSADGRVFYRISPHYRATLENRPPHKVQICKTNQGQCHHFADRPAHPPSH